MPGQHPRHDPKGTARLLHEAFEALRNLASARADEEDRPHLGLTQARVLQHVVFSGGSLSDIARRSGISRQAVARATAELEDLGLLTTRPVDGDRRALQGELTSAGRLVFEEIRSRVAQLELQLEVLLGPRRYRSLRKMLVEISALEPEDPPSEASG